MAEAFMSLATAGKATGGFSSWLLDQGEVDPLAPYQNSSLSILLAYSEGADFVVEPADALPFPALVEDGGELYRARAVNGGGHGLGALHRELCDRATG